MSEVTTDLPLRKARNNIIAKLRQLRRRLKAQGFDDDIDARMIEHFFRPTGEQRFALAEPFFSLWIARVNLADLKLDTVTDLSLEIAK